MLAVAGLTFTYTSCTDYSEDIDANKDSIDAVKTEVDGKLSSLSEQLSSVNKTIEELKTADAAAAKSVEALEASSAALKEQLAALENSFDANKEAVTTKYDAEVGKINAAIVELKEAYATADGNLKNELQSQIDTNKAKIDTLNARLEKQISALEEAYKNADAELKSQILANATAISGLQTDIKTINEETIPAAKAHAENLVNALKSDVAETYATKAALTDSTAKVTKLVNSAVVTLTARLESAEKRLTSLEAAQKAFEEDLKKTKESYDAQIETINAEIAANKTAISLLGSDAAAVRKVLDSLDTKLKAAAAAAAAAQKTADNAVAAAAAAQTTANNAVAAAAAAKTAADNAQKTADEALGKVESLIEALGVYAKKDSLKIKIELLFEKDFLLAQKANELAAKDLELSGDIADLDAKVDSLVKAANDRIDSVITAFNGKIADLAAADKKMGEQIAELFADKFDKTAFAGEFKAAYDARFGEDFRTAYEARFSKDFDAAFSKAWNAKYDAAFKDAFSEAWGTNFTASFDNALDTVWDDRFEESFDGAIAAYIATALAADGVIYAKIDELVGDATTALEAKIKEVRKNLEKQISDAETKLAGQISGNKTELEAKIAAAEKTLKELIAAGDGDLQKQIDAITSTIGSLDSDLLKQIEENSASFKAVNDKIDAEVKRIDEAIGEIRLIVNELVSSRVQSIVFVPEYADLKASFYYYTVNGEPVSDDKIVEATFEVYPKSAAATLNNDNVKVVAVNVKSTRASAFVEGEILNEVKADANGRVTVKVKFGEELDYDSKADIAVAMRVENDEEGYSFVESSYVGVTKVAGSEIKGNYVIYDFTNKKEITDAELSEEVAWSVLPDSSKFAPFTGYEIAFKIGDKKIGDKYYTLADAAKELSIDVKYITPELSYTDKYYTSADVETAAYNKYYAVTKKTAAAELANVGVAMTSKVQDKVAEDTKAGLNVAEPVGTYCKTAITAKVAGQEVAKLAKTLKYTIVKREAIITLKPTEKVSTYEFPWTYAKAEALSSEKNLAKAYDKAIDKSIDSDLGEFLAVIEYPNGGDKFGFKEVITAAGGVDTKVLDEAGKEVSLSGKSDITLGYSVVSSTNAYIADVNITGYKSFFDGKKYTLKNEYVHQSTSVTVKMDVKLGELPKFGDVVVSTEENPTVLKYIPDAASVASVDAVAKAYAVADSNKVFFKDSTEFAKSITASAAGYYTGTAAAPVIGTVTPGTAGDTGTEWQKACVNATRKDDNKSKYVALDAAKGAAYTFLVPANGSVAKDSYNVETKGSYIRISCNSSVSNFDNKFGFVTKFTPWYGNGESFSFKAYAKLDRPTYTLSIYGDAVTKVDATNGTVKLVGTRTSSSYYSTAKFTIPANDLSKYVRVVNGEGKYTLDDKDVDVNKLRVKYEVVTKADATNGYSNVPTLSTAATVDENGAIAETKLDWTGYSARDIDVKATLSYNGLPIGESVNLNLWFDDPVTMSLDGEPGEGGAYVYEETRTPSKKLEVKLWKYLTIKTFGSSYANDIRPTAYALNDYAWNGSANTIFGLGLEFELDRDNIKVGNVLDPLSVDKLYLEDGKLIYAADDAIQANDVLIPIKVTLTHSFNYDNKYTEANGNSEDDHVKTFYIKVPKTATE